MALNKNLFRQQILQAFYFSLALVNDFIGTNERDVKDRPLIRRIKDFTYSAFAFPLAMNVAILFWTIYAFDRDMVLPEAADAIFPSWLNHILHTNVAVFIVIEMLVLHRQYPDRKSGILGLMAFNFAYLVWGHITRYYAGRWVYPILEVLDAYSKVAFYVFTLAILPLAFYFLGENLNVMIWGKHRFNKLEN